MIAGNCPSSSGQTTKLGWRPYFVVMITSFSIIELPLQVWRRIQAGMQRGWSMIFSRIQQAAGPGEQHVIDPDEFHEILPHGLTRGANAARRSRNSRLHLAMLWISRMAQRLREIQHA